MGQDQRRHHRVGVALEMLVRGVGHDALPFEEATSSEVVSRGGCSFLTSHELDVGTELELEILRRAAGHRGPTPFLTTGAVLRAARFDPGHYLICVRFTGPQFPTFVSETTAGA